jgi:hypothetical protein
LEPAAADADPLPSSSKAGAIEVTPTDVVVTERDDRLRLTLRTDTLEPVAFRVETNGPHLSATTTHGEFEGDTVVEVAIDPSRAHGLDVPGTIRFMTTLGDVVVNAPLRVGLTGRYEGALRYSVGGVPLGDARIVLDVQETLGDVLVSVDPERSLLFPARDGIPTRGRGAYTQSEGLEVTLSHSFGADLGGTRNHFARPIGREIRLSLQAAGAQTLEGSFEERIFGVLEQPIIARGTVQLRTRPLLETLDLPPPEPVTMPSVAIGSLSMAAFDERTAVPTFAAATEVLPSSCQSDTGAASCLAGMSDYFYGGLARALAGVSTSTNPLGDLGSICERELYLDLSNWASLSPSGGECAHVGGLLAALRELALGYSPSASEAAGLFHLTLSRLLAPHLLVAQEHLVVGARESFLTGSRRQGQEYEAARDVLSAPARWVLQPRILEFLRRTSPKDAAGAVAGTDASRTDYPALRALGRLLYVLSSIEGELASLAASEPTSSRAQLILETQENALVTVLEASALSALVEDWPSIPEGVGTELVGALTPLDRGFGILLDGSVLFGVPEGEVPLSFDPSRPQPTNFEQILLLRAAPTLAPRGPWHRARTGSRRTRGDHRQHLRRRVRAGHIGRWRLAALW